VSICTTDFLNVIKHLPNFHLLEYRDDPKKRPNHLTKTQNKEFAEYLYKHINESDFDIHSTFNSPEKYYTMSKTLEDSGFIV
jgi:hypothetical protein